MPESDRSPGAKLALAILVGLFLSFTLFFVWLMVYDRQQQSQTAQASIAEGWAGPQVVGGPLLVIPYAKDVTETVTDNGQQVTRTRRVIDRLTLSPEQVALDTEVRPVLVTRSIYEIVVYDAAMRGHARFAIPADLARFGVTRDQLDLGAAEIRFGLTDPRGLGANPRVSAGGRPLRLQPGGGTSATGGRGFFAWIDATTLGAGPLDVDFAFDFRGNRSLGLAPRAGDTSWRLRSRWPHPSFQGSFLPTGRRIGPDGFEAVYRFGNLALGQTLVTTGDAGVTQADGSPTAASSEPEAATNAVNGAGLAQVSLMQPVDLYSQVDRTTKYGFLFIGFTFLAFLLFDVIGGVRVSAVEYLLIGAGLVLFFVLLLAFAEVVGFPLAYVIAAGAITALDTFYSAAVLKSWRRAGFIAALLIGLYAVLYVLLSLEAYSLLIGALMLFAALAAVMYLTRNLNWGRAVVVSDVPVPDEAA